MNKRRIKKILVISFVLGVLSPLAAFADGQVKAALDGFASVPTLSSPASSEFAARINEGSIEYSLSYAGFGTSVLFAHIHLGRRATNGGVIAFLCTNEDEPAGVPPCPLKSGTVSGTILAEDAHKNIKRGPTRMALT